jgi:hypothetical protein
MQRRANFELAAAMGQHVSSRCFVPLRPFAAHLSTASAANLGRGSSAIDFDCQRGSPLAFVPRGFL